LAILRGGGGCVTIGYWLLKDSLTRKMGLLAEGGLTAQDVRERELPPATHHHAYLL
jgi:hypothetical protein